LNSPIGSRRSGWRKFPRIWRYANLNAARANVPSTIGLSVSVAFRTLAKSLCICGSRLQISITSTSPDTSNPATQDRPLPRQLRTKGEQAITFRLLTFRCSVALRTAHEWSGKPARWHLSILSRHDGRSVQNNFSIQLKFEPPLDGKCGIRSASKSPQALIRTSHDNGVRAGLQWRNK